MKTYTIDLASYKDVPIEKVDLSELNGYIEKNLQLATRKYKQMIQVTDLQKKDMVTLNLTSKNSKFNRSGLKLTIGSNLYSKELEEQLIGLNVKDNKTFIINNEEVHVEVLESIRAYFPKVTDEMVKEYANGIDEWNGITSVDEFINRLTEKYKEEKYRETLYKNMDKVLTYVATHTPFEFDENEVNEIYEMFIENVKTQLQKDEKTIESLTQEEFKLMFNVDDYESFKQMIWDTSEYYLACSYVQVTLEGKDPKDYTYLSAQELGWDQLTKYVESQMSTN